MKKVTEMNDMKRSLNKAGILFAAQNQQNIANNSLRIRTIYPQFQGYRVLAASETRHRHT